MKAVTYFKIAGILNLLTFFLHIIGGQLDLVNPLLETQLPLELKAQWVGAWHMVSLILLATSYVLLTAGFTHKYTRHIELLSFVSYLNLVFCLPFLIAGFYYGLLVPQWILFLPIAVFSILGLNKIKKQHA